MHDLPIPLLVQQLTNTSRASDAVVRLLAHGHAAHPVLIAALAHDDPSVRITVIQILAKHPSPAVVAALVTTITHEDRETRQYAAAALKGINDASALPLLRQIVQTPVFAERRDLAITVLGWLQDATSFDFLVDLLLHDPLPNIRRSAAGALGELRDQRAYAPLIIALGDAQDDPLCMSQVLLALGRSGDPRALTPLLDALTSEDVMLQTTVPGALGELGDPRAIAPLIARLTPTYSSLSANILMALNRFRTPESEAAIAQIRDQGDARLHQVLTMLIR